MDIFEEYECDGQMSLFDLINNNSDDNSSKKLYEIFSGDDLKIAEKIQQRRLQILVHSYIYYELDENIISDNQWATWGKELVELQEKYPDIADRVIYSEEFKGFDASTGQGLPFHDKRITDIADRLLQSREKGEER